MPSRPRRPQRPPVNRPRTCCAGTIALLVMLAGCQACPPIPAPPPPLPVRAPCLDAAAVPAPPALTLERLPADAPAVDLQTAALVDRERLIGYAAQAAVLLAGCVR